MFCLSFDCANKSLAVGLYKIDNDLVKSIRDIINRYKLCQSDTEKVGGMKSDIDSLINIIYIDVLYLIPDKKVKDSSILDRTRGLKEKLVSINKIIEDEVHLSNDEKIKVFIEYQMNVNDKSRTIYNQLIYEYIDETKYEIIIMKPHLKNTIYLSEELKYCDILKNYNSVYRCNKQHSKLNFLHFIEVFGLQDKIKHIKKKNLDDIADTFMQMLSYIILL